jgi:hypothetical protein
LQSDGGRKKRDAVANDVRMCARGCVCQKETLRDKVRIFFHFTIFRGY